MKPGCAPGTDGITSEHLKFASNSGVILHLCKLLTVCFQFGLVPTSFTKGILIPILKKPTQDPSQPKNYRPIIVSNTVSKIMELYILYECNDHKFSEFQFGFVTGRGSNSAVALVHDVASYFNAKGSTIFMCGLDVEGAFNGVPHPVLFDRARNVITDKSWKLLYNWYVNSFTTTSFK